MTNTDRETGLPIVGAPPANVNIVPIDPKLLPELREKLKAARDITEQAIPIGVSLIAALTSAITVGVKGRQAEAEANEFINSLVRVHGVDVAAIQDKPLEEWLDTEKGQIRVPRG